MAQQIRFMVVAGFHSAQYIEQPSDPLASTAKQSAVICERLLEPALGFDLVHHVRVEHNTPGGTPQPPPVSEVERVKHYRHSRRLVNTSIVRDCCQLARCRPEFYRRWHSARPKLGRRRFAELLPRCQP